VAARRQRSLRLRTRVTLFFSLTALVASLALAVVTYGVARNFLVDQRSQVIVTQAISNATRVRTTLLDTPPPTSRSIDDLMKSLKRSGEGFAFLSVIGQNNWFSDASFQRSAYPPNLVLVVGQGGGATVTFSSLLQFYIRSGMTADEFAQIEGQITTATGRYIIGMVNVNTASEAVLACIPGISTDKASALVAYRQSNPSLLPSIAWVSQVLDQRSAIRAGPYLTARTYQFTADIAAVGHYGRGYRRVKYIFDTSQGTPRILYRQDLSHFGWALGKNARQALLVAKLSR
jgi:hypothetical protein